jgi:hypothetical protein
VHHDRIRVASTELVTDRRTHRVRALKQHIGEEIAPGDLSAADPFDLSRSKSCGTVRGCRCPSAALWRAGTWHRRLGGRGAWRNLQLPSNPAAARLAMPVLPASPRRAEAGPRPGSPAADYLRPAASSRWSWVRRVPGCAPHGPARRDGTGAAPLSAMPAERGRQSREVSDRDEAR